jgi:NADPH-dependent 2,4-dienoyl-CoA reductase/sulfur reductase-like enzyme
MATRFPSMPPGILPEAPSGLRAAAAKHHINTYLSKKLSEHNKENKTYETLPRYAIEPHDESEDHYGLQGSSYSGRVCIVGAGAAGLYTAMMLKWLGITNVEILEASDHVGGRCATYHFEDSYPCKHDYYDMGAMRIPDIDSMNS